MDFSKLIQDEFTPEWVKSVIHDLSPYPYLADILVIVSSFAAGALISLVLFLLLRRILNRFYSRHWHSTTRRKRRCCWRATITA